jgi:hypothetical protein
VHVSLSAAKHRREKKRSNAAVAHLIKRQHGMGSVSRLRAQLHHRLPLSAGSRKIEFLNNAMACVVCDGGSRSRSIAHNVM